MSKIGEQMKQAKKSKKKKIITFQLFIFNLICQNQRISLLFAESRMLELIWSHNVHSSLNLPLLFFFHCGVTFRRIAKLIKPLCSDIVVQPVCDRMNRLVPFLSKEPQTTNHNVFNNFWGPWSGIQWLRRLSHVNPRNNTVSSSLWQENQ